MQQQIYDKVKEGTGLESRKCLQKPKGKTNNGEASRQRPMLLCLIGGAGVLSHFPPTFVDPTRLIFPFCFISFHLRTGIQIGRFESSVHDMGDNGLVFGLLPEEVSKPDVV